MSEKRKSRMCWGEVDPAQIPNLIENCRKRNVGEEAKSLVVSFERKRTNSVFVKQVFTEDVIIRDQVRVVLGNFIYSEISNLIKICLQRKVHEKMKVVLSIPKYPNKNLPVHIKVSLIVPSPSIDEPNMLVLASELER